MLMLRRAVVLLVAIALLVGGAFVVARRSRTLCWIGEDRCEGIRIGGKVVEAEVSIEASLQQRASLLEARTLRVSVADLPDIAKTFTLGELGVRLDSERMAALARAVGHTGTWLDRWAQARAARRGIIDIPVLVEVDPNIARRSLSPLKDAADELGAPARLDVVRRVAVGEVPGRFVDLDSALERIREIAMHGGEALDLVRVSVPPRTSAAFLTGIDTGEILGRFQTGFSRAGQQESRARNIETAAAKLDGVVLLPGELFSFNSVVGPRTQENGFSKGWQIFKGEMVEGIGGGTCQVASTLHAVAMFSGLDIVERLPHSRPSAYITMGLDATVVYPVVDLKLRNPFEFPVIVHSYVEKNVVVFELFGQKRAAHVVFGREVLATRPFSRKIEEKPGVPRNRIVRKQHGILGYKVRRTRTIDYANGTRRTESNVDIYPPTVEAYWVAPGVDPTDMLPPMEGAGEPDGQVSTRWRPVKEKVGAGGDSSRAEERQPEAAGAASAAGAAGAAGPAAACSGRCDPGSTVIINLPGVHAPTPSQARAPVRVVIAAPMPPVPPPGGRGNAPVR